ncbi:MAG: hypothetical protein M3014_06915 [Chloroflexota bacterium]|nr:hypothetical protein [Chloroflexota bacterium]
MANDLQKLLRYIVEHPVMQDEMRESELDATAVRDVPAEISAIAADKMSEAERLSSYFGHGLKMALASNGRITVDDTTPEGNGIADAFARFLVAPSLATSQSTDLPDMHYSYTFDVSMPALQEIARKAGVDLNSALASA